MYKIEEFVGTAAELEKFLNERQIYLEYAKENLCKDCLTGNKERCNAKAHYRINKVV